MNAAREQDARRAALVTGGTRGIGRGIAESLAAEGFDLALNGVREAASVEPVLDELRRRGGQVVYCRGDLSDAGQRREVLDATRTAFGRLDLLVNNAGMASPGRKDMLELDEVTFDKVFDVNLKGPFFLTQAAAAWMIEQRRERSQFRGCIVNIGSISADVASTNRVDYCMTKAAITMATKSWAARLAEHEIDVYEVRPGIIETDMTAPVKAKYDKLIAEGLTLERRWGRPDDIGRAVAMLARGDLPYATGQVLTLDGGLTLQRL